jgi:hypothetical protein
MWHAKCMGQRGLQGRSRGGGGDQSGKERDDGDAGAHELSVALSLSGWVPAGAKMGRLAHTGAVFARG